GHRRLPALFGEVPCDLHVAFISTVGRRKWRRLFGTCERRPQDQHQRGRDAGHVLVLARKSGDASPRRRLAQLRVTAVKLHGSINHVSIVVSQLDEAMAFLGPFLEFFGYTAGAPSPYAGTRVAVNVSEA